MRTSFRRPALLGLALLTVLGGTTQGFVKSRGKWQVWPVPYRIHLGGLPAVGNGSEFSAIQRAFQTWEDIPTSAIAFSYQGTTETANGGNDGTNVISFQDSSFSFGSGTIAVTLSTFAPDRFFDVDILFNPALPFATDGSSTAFDIQAIATHEIGHFLGLDHTAIVSAVMNPTGSRGALFPRKLTGDDILGAAVLYPESSFLSSTGRLSGKISNAGVDVFGAHVVVLDAQGRPVVSALSTLDGTYEFSGLPPGTYSLYAEPLDGPVTEASIGGIFDSRVATNFAPTFLGDTRDLNMRLTVTVSAGNELRNLNIHVLPSPAAAFDLVSPSLGSRIAQGQATSVAVRGAGVASGTTFSVLGNDVGLSSPTFSGVETARTEATVASGAATGPRTLFAHKQGGLATLSGGVVVTGPPPTIGSIAPNSGLSEGGTRVTVRGSGFVAGTEVSIGGVSLTDVLLLDSTTLQGTTPPNKAGGLNVLAVNPDGTSAILVGGFVSQSLPPTLLAIVPDSGPPTTVVLLQGTHFDLSVANNRVFFNGVEGRVIKASSSELTVVVPVGAATGPVRVVVAGQEVVGPIFTVTASLNLAEPQFQYIDASDTAGGSVLTFTDGVDPRDDSTVPTSLPFDFTFFSSTFLSGSVISVATNGWISLSSAVPFAEFQNGPLPGTMVPREGAAGGTVGALPANLVAPFFDDLILSRADSVVFQRVTGTRPNRRLVIEWRNLRILDQDGAEIPNSRLSFQIILFEGSNDIAFQYLDLQGNRSRGQSATIGIQDASRSRAVQFSYNQARLAPGKAIVFHFDPQSGEYQLEASPNRYHAPFVIDTPIFRTNLGVINVSAEAQVATIALHDDSGQILATRRTTVPPNGLTQLNNVIRSVRGLDPGRISESFGSLTVSSPQDLVLFSSQIDNRSNDPGLQVGLQVGAATLLIPSTTSVNQFRSSLIVRNAEDRDARVVLRQRDQFGAVLTEQAITISSNGFFQTENLHAFLGLSGVFGPLEITAANEERLVATSRVYTESSATSGFFEAFDVNLAAFTGVIPVSLDNVDFRTNLGINNLGDGAATVQIELIDATGTTLATREVQVPPRGLLQIDQVNRFLLGQTVLTNTLAHIRLRGDQLIHAFSSVINNRGDDPGLAQSLVEGSNRLLIPSVTNVNQFRSTLTLVNLSDSLSASVRLTAWDVEGRPLAQSSQISIPPNGLYDTRDVLSSLGVTGQYGPLEILSLNGVTLAAVSRVYSINDDTSGFFIGQLP
ncbi:MAG: IPT/TIG domain-containing protein [Acidobacteriota bacterium]